MIDLRQAETVLLVGPMQIAPAILKRALKESTYCVAIDGGIAHFKKAKRVADLVIGDFDSVKNRSDLVKFARVQIKFPVDKDESDFSLALEAVRKMGIKATRVIGVGLTGGRADHELGNLLEMANFLKHPGKLPELEEVSFRDANAMHFFMDGRQLPSAELTLSRGALFSIFSLNGTAKGVTVGGARFKLKNAELSPSSRGLSNLATGGLGKPVTIQLRSGQLVVVVLTV